jgi:hypothetical protein
VIADAAAQGELDLESAGVDAGQAAELFVDAARGLQGAGAMPQNPARYRRRVGRLVRLLAAGLGAHSN